MNVIIPICGVGMRFQAAGYSVPKPLILINNNYIIANIIDNLDLKKDDKLFIIYHTSLDEYNFRDILLSKYPNIILIPISHRTGGAAETVLLGINHILSNKLSDLNNCLLIDGDTIYHKNILKKLRKDITKNSVIYFKDYSTNPIFSYIQLKDDDIVDIREKEKISNNANTGAYFFVDINILRDSCNYIVKNNISFKNEYYTSCVIKYMLSKSIEFKGVLIDRKYYKSLGTPDELKIYQENHYGFLFDLDGTIVKTDNIYYKVWQEILLNFNISLTSEIFSHFIQGNNDHYAMERLQIDKAHYNINDISKQKDSLFRKYIDDITIIDGVKDLIKLVHKLGHSICIVTNCNRDTCEAILNYIGIKQYVSHIVIGNECTRPKPYPDPYLKAIDLLDSCPNRCIIFEDSKPGLLSALSVSPRNIIGVDNGTNLHILNELNIQNIFSNFDTINIDYIINVSSNVSDKIRKMIINSLSKQYDIKDIELDMNKLKGGYISDVIKVKLNLINNTSLDCILKYENDYTSSLTQMAYKLGLFDREYYFYESISNYINVLTPKYIGTIKDDNFISKGILLENINKEGFTLNLDLNREIIDVPLKIIEQCAKFHALFWNKNLSKSFKNLKKHNDSMFNPIWGNFVRERWPLFFDKWKHLLSPKVVDKLEFIVLHFNEIQERLSTGQLTLCHGDVKSGNIFYRKSSESYIPYFIDWQYISNGKGVQDIVFFLIESFNRDKIIEYIEVFKNYYYIKLKEFGVKAYSYEDYTQDFKDAVCYFPLFVAIWFGTTPTDELIDVSFPFIFIQKLVYFIDYLF